MRLKTIGIVASEQITPIIIPIDEARTALGARRGRQMEAAEADFQSSS